MSLMHQQLFRIVNSTILPDCLLGSGGMVCERHGGVSACCNVDSSCVIQCDCLNGIYLVS